MKENFIKYNKIIERKVYWSFDLLEERLMIKLKYLALISAWTNKIDNWIYFKYYKMDIYVLKSFANFLKLLEDGTIKVIIKKGIYTNEKRYGDMYDHGTGFTIKEKDLIKLFYRCVNNL